MTTALDATPCTKTGVLLTCYINGRKRFRATPSPLTLTVDEPDADYVSTRRDSRDVQRSQRPARAPAARIRRKK